MSQPSILNESELELSPAEMLSLIYSAGDMAQGSEEWFAERRGKVTASRVKAVVSRDRYGKPYKDYYEYMMQLAIERTSDKEERFSSKYTEHGKEYEDWIAGQYEELTGREVRECEFVEHPEIAAGASPDRFVEDDGTLEIKAPNSRTLLKYLVSMIPKQIDGQDNPEYELVEILGLKGDEWKYYYEQIQMQLWVTGRKWCDFTVGDPDVHENIQVVIKRVERDDEYISTIMEPRVREFLDKVAKLERYILDYSVEV
jgi:predicted phage-related endonuclease